MGVRCRYRVNLHGAVPRNSTVLLQPHYYYVHVQEMQLVQGYAGSMASQKNNSNFCISLLDWPISL